MSEVIERFFNGFCRTQNQMQMITCEYSKQDQKLHLEHADCAFRKCAHNDNCEIMKQAYQLEQTEMCEKE